MKLRIRGNTIRFRLSQKEVMQFSETGQVEDATVFGAGPDERLTYAIRVDEGTKEVSVDYSPGAVVVLCPVATATQWVEGDDEGFDGNIEIGGDTLRISVEKDFECLHKEPREDDQGSYPHPAKG